jgi:hypothetical protein
VSKPLIPGKGAGNSLLWPAGQQPADMRAFGQAAWEAFYKFVGDNSQQLEIDMDELSSDAARVTVHRDGKIVQIYVPRNVNRVPVKNSCFAAGINEGNLVLFGATKWANIDVLTVPVLNKADAMEAVQNFAGESIMIDGTWKESELSIVPVANGKSPNSAPFGNGYDHRLVWIVRPIFEAYDDPVHRYEAFVDAISGQILSLQDTVDYLSRKVLGGVYPVSNDGALPDGVQQPNWHMPFDIVDTSTGFLETDAGGNLLSYVSGDITSTLSGKYIHMNDNCGTISLTSSFGDINFGTSNTDCLTPGFGGAGNTASSRTCFHELNRMMEIGRSHLPGNSWLKQQLTANVNINNNCNAYWNGQVNFYKSGGGCRNTGEIAGVVVHEWGKCFLFASNKQLHPALVGSKLPFFARIRPRFGRQ